MAFLILDPYLFIYPSGEQEPLDRKKVTQFVLTMNEWAKLLNQNDHEFGMAEDCLALLKTHPRSILNGKFLSEVSQLFGKTFAQISQVLDRLFRTLKCKLTFSAAMQTIEREKLYFEIKQTTIAPGEFVTRLPVYFHQPFLKMLGDLTFARAQGFYPIAAFERVDFVTTNNAQLDFLMADQRLFTSVHVDYVLDPAVDAAQQLTSPIADEFDILLDASSVAETQPMAPIRTLRAAVEAARQTCGNAVVISRELEQQLKKADDVIANAEQIENAIKALGLLWLPEYLVRRKQHYARDAAIEFATRKFRQFVPHVISDEGENVHNNPKLREQRLVRYGQQEAFAYFHVKISPRIYFGILNYKGQDIIVLGHIGHLDTARYGASTTA